MQTSESSPSSFYEVLTTATPRVWVTPTLVAVNVLYFAVGVALGVSPVEPDSGALISLGANFGPLTFAGEWWRLLSAAFVHIGLLHLALNMWCLWSLGMVAERMFGNGVFLIIYFASGLGGSLGSLLWHPYIISAGASGAIFGISGALVAFLYLGQIQVPQRVVKDLLGSLMFFVGFNLFFGAVWEGIDNAGHLGGLVVGVAMGALLNRPLPSGRTPPTRFLILPALALLFWGTASLARDKGSNDPRLLAANALRRYVAGDADGALSELERAVELDPKLIEGFLQLGQLHMEAGRLVEAVAAFRRAIELDPALYEPQRDLGVALALSGQKDEAIEALRIARRMKPADVSIYVVASSLLLEAGRLDEAVAVLEEALTWAPESAQVWSAMGLARLRREEIAEAVTALERAATAEPDFAEHHNRLSLALARAGEGDRALRSIERALELTPDLPHLLDSLGTVRFYRGELDRAVDAYQRAVSLSPEHAVYTFNLSLALAREGRLGEAETARAEALRLDPSLAATKGNEPIL